MEKTTSARSPMMGDIAKYCGVSIATVSRALKNHPALPDSTCRRIQTAADKLGYHMHPFLSTLMSLRRASKPSTAAPVIAFVTRHPARETWKSNAVIVNMFKGASRRAEELGYNLEVFWQREQNFGRMLYTRNIQGLLIAPTLKAWSHVRFNYESFSVVTLGYTLTRPEFDRVCHDSFAAALTTVRQCCKHGYQRIGLVMDRDLNPRTDYRWVGGFVAAQRELPADQRVPPLIRTRVMKKPEFLRWLDQHQPDVIIGLNVFLRTLQQWQAESRSGARCGWVDSDMIAVDGSIAGIFQDHFLLGAYAVDQLTSMMQRNQRGVPPHPRSLMFPGSWCDGASLPALQRNSARAN